MTQETEQLQQEIRAAQDKFKKHTTKKAPLTGYNTAITILTDLLGCIFVGFAIGLFLQKTFHESPLLVAGFTLLGGIAGLYTTIRYALSQEKK